MPSARSESTRSTVEIPREGAGAGGRGGGTWQEQGQRPGNTPEGASAPGGTATGPASEGTPVGSQQQAGGHAEPSDPTPISHPAWHSPAAQHTPARTARASQGSRVGVQVGGMRIARRVVVRGLDAQS